MIYIIEADDEYILDKKVHEICEKNIGRINEFNFSSYDIQDETISNITGAFMSNSMFDDKKVVVITGANFLTKKKEKVKYVDEKNIPDLFLLLEKMSKENSVIFPIIDASLTTSNKFLEKIKYEYIVCDKIGHEYKDYGEQLKIYDKYASEIISDINAKLDEDAYNLLKSYWLPLYEFKNELIKLTNYDENITVETISKLTSAPISNSIFELTNSLFKNDKENALKIYKDLITNNTDVIQILNTCASVVHFLYMVKYLLDKGNDAYKIADILDESSARIKKNIPTANISSLEGIRKVLLELSDLDYAIKKGQLPDPTFAFSNFILNFSLK